MPIHIEFNCLGGDKKFNNQSWYIMHMNNCAFELYQSISIIMTILIYDNMYQNIFINE